MIKREHIKQAIDAVSKRDPEVGYALNEMLGTGKIDASHQTDSSTKGEDPHFFFDSEKVSINKFLYFNEGVVPIEQRLLVKYGEMVKRQELLNRTEPPDYKQVAVEIRNAGLKFMVMHEIDYGLDRLKKGQGKAEGARNKEKLISFLVKVKQDMRPLGALEGECDIDVFYKGNIDEGTPACFMCFPFCVDSLMQVAYMNLEFFHVRFILDCLVRGFEKNLFVCVVDGQILGLLYLALKRRLFYMGLEIKYISTLRGNRGMEKEPTAGILKGVGSFLIAGAWMLWKTGPANIKEITLDSEMGARQFYERIGFQSRGLAGYVLRTPKGRLLKAILIMANMCEELSERILEEIRAIIRKQIKLLRKKPKDEKEECARKLILESVEECLKPEARPELAKTAMRMLVRYKKRIPESEKFIQFDSEYGPYEKESSKKRKFQK